MQPFPYLLWCLFPMKVSLFWPQHPRTIVSLALVWTVLSNVGLSAAFLSHAAWGLESQQRSQPIPTQDLHLAQRTPPPDTTNPRDRDPEADEPEEEDPTVDSELQPFEEAIEDRQVVEGLFTLYYDEDDRLLSAKIQPEQLGNTYLLQSNLSRGLGEFGLYRGMPLQDLPFTLRRVQNQIQVVVPNSSIRSRPGDVTEPFRDQFFSDSTIISLPIISIHDETKGILVDLQPLLDITSPSFQNLSLWVGFLGYGASSSRLETVSAFPLNLELEVLYDFTGGGGDSFFTPVSIPNPNAFTLGVHYSLSKIEPNPDYQPRLADERVGYFLTAYWDLGDRRSRDPFVRYINRWHLQKQDPTAALSPPTKPIVFWLENTIPPDYRAAVERGVLAWNKAFEDLGFQDAIQVKQMPDDADWDPADVRYNTIRWTTSLDGGFALGPSRVNPYTGEILDSDILIDENYVRYNAIQFGTLGHGTMESQLPWPSLTGDPRVCDARLGMALLKTPELRQQLPTLSNSAAFSDRCYSQQAQQLLGLGALSLSLTRNVLPSSPEMQKFLNESVSHVVAHEVGHALGLRHNFHGSTHLSPAQLQDPQVGQEQMLSSSVMDYLPPNLAAPGQPQGDYFPLGIGPYDQWAIDYGYRPLPPNASPSETQRFLKAIADRAVDLDYGTDEDAYTNLDPDIALFDLSNDTLTYSQGQMDLARSLWETLDRRYPAPGESYSETRAAFNQIFSHYVFNAYQLTQYVGGRSLTRYLGGDTQDHYPLEPVDVAKQREALAILNDRLFRAEAFDFPPNLVRQMPSSRWYHWAASPSFTSVEYPLADQVLIWQTLVMADLFSPDRLSRLRDTALQYPGVEPLTLPELFESLQDNIWVQYLDFQPDQQEIPLLQRRLQDQYVTLLVTLTQEGYGAVENAIAFPDFLIAIYTLGAPREAKVLARHYLETLGKTVQKAQRRDDRLDLESQLHLDNTYDRIQRALNPNP